MQIVLVFFMHTCKALETDHAVKKAKRMMKFWVIENSPKAGMGHGRNDINFARFAFDVTLLTACGRN